MTSKKIEYFNKIFKRINVGSYLRLGRPYHNFYIIISKVFMRLK